MSKEYEFEIDIRGELLETKSASKTYIIIAGTEQAAIEHAVDSFDKDFPGYTVKDVEVCAQYDLE